MLNGSGTTLRVGVRPLIKIELVVKPTLEIIIQSGVNLSGCYSLNAENNLGGSATYHAQNIHVSFFCCLLSAFL